MNDIEKEIEKDYEKKDNDEDIVKQKEERNTKNNHPRKTIILIIIGVILLIFIASFIYLILNNKQSKKEDKKEDLPVNKTEEENVNNKSIFYVSCDDNTSLLNVRNSTGGDIIDGLSCYKEVTVEEELESTENCDNWYKISYVKDNNNYTGYVCGTYIKKREIPENIFTETKKIIDKANDYYSISISKAYCGKTSTSKIINFDDNMTGEYLKSEYKNIDELKKYILSFLSENLIDTKLELSDINNPKYLDNYYEIDGNLYCRNYSANSVSSIKTDNYNLEVVDSEVGKTIVNVAYEYINEDSRCLLEDLSKCNNSDFSYKIKKITIENGIITKID